MIEAIAGVLTLIGVLLFPNEPPKPDPEEKLSPAYEMPAVPWPIDCGSYQARHDARLALACNIYHEAGTESFDGKLAVAGVTIRRAMNPKTPSIPITTWAPKQFSWTNKCHLKDGACKKNQFKVKYYPYWEEAWFVASIILDGSYKGELPGKNALWYHRDDVKPKWIKWKGIYECYRVGRHIFYCPVEPEKFGLTA